MGSPGRTTFRDAFEASYVFVTDTLLPHMQTIEQEIYPELERLMQNRHSMAPMRREHAELTRLVASLSVYRDALEADALGPSGSMGLRRVLYRLYALLKVHLAEEAEYLQVLDHNLSTAEQEALGPTHRPRRDAAPVGRHGQGSAASYLACGRGALTMAR